VEGAKPHATSGKNTHTPNMKIWEREENSTATGKKKELTGLLRLIAKGTGMVSLPPKSNRLTGRGEKKGGGAEWTRVIEGLERKSKGHPRGDNPNRILRINTHTKLSGKKPGGLKLQYTNNFKASRGGGGLEKTHKPETINSS